MPENFNRTALARSREGVGTAEHPDLSQALDLTTLTDQEEKIIQAVIQKDEAERSILDAKISEVRKEIQEIRKASALTTGDDQNTICARCKSKFMPFILPWADHGERCTTCKFRVCAKCRTKQPNGSWLCILCFKYRQEKLLTGEWMSKGQSPNLCGSDLLRVSLRESSQERADYEETNGVNYVQRPAKTKIVSSESDTSSDSSIDEPEVLEKANYKETNGVNCIQLPTTTQIISSESDTASDSSIDEPEELRKGKSGSQRTPSSISSTNLQNFKHRESPRYSGSGNGDVRHVTQIAPSEKGDGDSALGRRQDDTVTGRRFPKLKPVSSLPHRDANSFDNVVALLSTDTGEEVPLDLDGGDVDVTDAVDVSCVGGDNSTDRHNSVQNQNDYPYTSHDPQQPQEQRAKRAQLTRNVSVSEQTLYYDEKRATLNMPRLGSLDSRSTTSLCSKDSLNPKYRSLKPASGTSELELFRKRGERYSMRRKRTLENETSEEKEDSKPDITQDSTDISSSIEQNLSTDVNPNETQTPPDVKKAPIPHWHEILRMQSVVDTLTKQKSPTSTTPSRLLNARSSIDDKIFPLMKLQTKTNILKDPKYLSPNSSREDSSSSQESISVYVASYLSPTRNLDPENMFTSTPNTENGSKPMSESQISPVSSLNSPEWRRSTRSNQFKDSRLSSDSPQRNNVTLPRYKSARSYFNTFRSKSRSRPKDWGGKRKLPYVEAAVKREKEKRANDKVKSLTIQRRDSNSRALENQKVVSNPPKGNTNRNVILWKDSGSYSMHASADAEPLGLRRDHDSDTSSLGSCFADSQHVSSSTTNDGSSEDSKSLREEHISPRRHAGNAGARNSVSASGIPNKFRFRKLSSSCSQTQRSSSLESCSSEGKFKNIVEGVLHSTAGESNASKETRTSPDKYNSSKKILTNEGSSLMKISPKDDIAKNTSLYEEGSVKKTLSGRDDSFEEVYNSNVNIFKQMMNSGAQAAPENDNAKGSFSKQNRVLSQSSGDGKTSKLLFQWSLSLSKEMEENAKYQRSSDESDNEDKEAKSEKTTNVPGEGVQEERLLLPSEIRKQQNFWEVATSRLQVERPRSRLPIVKHSSLSGSGKTPAAQNRKTFDVSKKETSPKASVKNLGLKCSPDVQKNNDVATGFTLMQRSSHRLMLKDQSEVVGNLQRRQENPVVNLSRSGSNVSGNYSNVSEMSELRGEAEIYAYASDQGSDDTFHNSNITDSFSDYSDSGLKSDLVGSGKPYNVMKPRKHNISISISSVVRGSEPSSFQDNIQRICDHGDSSMGTDSGGDATSQFSNVPEDSNPEGYFIERDPSIDSRISDLDFEDLVCSTMSRESTESGRDMKPAGKVKLTTSIQRAPSKGGKNNIVESTADDNEVKHRQLMYNKVDKTTVKSKGDLSEKDIDHQITSLHQVTQHQQRLSDCPSDFSDDSYQPDFKVSLDDDGCANDKSKWTNKRASHLLKKQDSNSEEDVASTEPARDTVGGLTDGNMSGFCSTEQPDRVPGPLNDHMSVPAVAVTSTMGDQQNVQEVDDEEEEEDDDLDELFNNHQPNQLLGSRNSLADSRESVYSVYSDAGEVNCGRIPVTGEIMFNLNYNVKSSMLEVHLMQCRDLAPVDTKHKKSDPYVKMYLLPDKSRSSKRKSKIKKHTLCPVFDEVLKYQIGKAELESRSLWVTVWHNDHFGRNDFLGEVTIPLDYYGFENNSPRWYTLQDRVVTQDPMIGYKGDLFISLKYITADMVETSPKKKFGSARKKNKEKDKSQSSLGEIHVLVKEAQNLTAMRGAAGSDPFCKGYLLPDVSHTSKQKTPVIRKTTNPQWQSIFVFEGVDQSQLHQHGLELTIWDFERLSSNDFLGGVRLSLGQGTHQGKPAECMDSKGEEVVAWQSMMDNPNEWVDIQLPLRITMGKQIIKK